MDLRDNKVWLSSRSERRQHRRIATRGLISLGIWNVLRSWTDKENLETKTIVNRREREKTRLRWLNQNHTFCG